MRTADVAHFAWRSIAGYPARTLLMVLAMSIGVAAVVVLWWFALLAEGMAVTVGLAAGVLPARRAARMEPVDALRAE